ncbi:hypothetical protein [Desulfotomaculum nigrificans]|uniref:hypothetical protein n=1 Tax=Desulfotomaculum nigrificans TaxID=1565 RepID=UPI0001FAEECA|nr:hypothetical protein [Desulfotomaculum nigrificans]
MSVMRTELRNIEQSKPGSVLENARANAKNPKVAIIGFILSWIVFFLIKDGLPDVAGLKPAAKTTIAIMAWVIVIWVTDALPKSISGLAIPLMLIATGVFVKP